MDDVFIRVTITMLKPQDQKQLGEERVCLAYTSRSHFIAVRIRAGTEAEP